MASIQNTPAPSFILDIVNKASQESTSGASTATRTTGSAAAAESDRTSGPAPISTGSTAASERMAGIRREAFATDMSANPGLVNALGVAGLHPNPEGLARVAQGAIVAPSEFTGLVNAANVVALSGGASPRANDALSSSIGAFTQSAKIRATDQGDIAYLLARLMMQQDATEREDTIKLMEAAKAQAEALLEHLEKERTDLDKDVEAQPANNDSGKKSDDFAPEASKVSDTADKKAEMSRLDSQISSQRDLITDLQHQIAGAKAGRGAGEGSNQDLINEAIMMMVERSNTMVSANQELANNIRSAGRVSETSASTSGGQSGGTGTPSSDTSSSV